MTTTINSVTARQATWGRYWVVAATRDGMPVEMQFNQDERPTDEQIAAQLEVENAPAAL